VQTTLPREQALTFLDEEGLWCCARANLLDRGDDIRFSHQLLQEYFTALMMAEKFKQGQLDSAQLWPHDRFWQTSGWEEATVLLTGFYPEDCSPVLRWLLPVHRNCWPVALNQPDFPLTISYYMNSSSIGNIFG
jgi:hypothetical protein